MAEIISKGSGGAANIPVFIDILAAKLAVTSTSSTPTTVVEYHGKCELLSLHAYLGAVAGKTTAFKITCDDNVYTFTYISSESSTQYGETYIPLCGGYFNMAPMEGGVIYITDQKRFAHVSLQDKQVMAGVGAKNDTCSLSFAGGINNAFIQNIFKAKNHLKVELDHAELSSSAYNITAAIGVID